MQVDHPPGKSGKVRQFPSGHGKVRQNEKVRRNKSAKPTFEFVGCSVIKLHTSVKTSLENAWISVVTVIKIGVATADFFSKTETNQNCSFRFLH